MAEVSKEYKTISQIAGPLVFVKKTEPIAYGELVSVRLSDGSMKRGEERSLIHLTTSSSSRSTREPPVSTEMHQSVSSVRR